jgi:hypothetical protein
MAATRANKNRAIRQEALREQLANQGHLQHVIDLAKKIEEQAEALTLDNTQLQAYKVVIDTKLKLVDKYLPSLKSTELTTIGDEGQVTGFKIEVVDASTSKDT